MILDSERILVAFAVGFAAWLLFDGILKLICFTISLFLGMTLVFWFWSSPYFGNIAKELEASEESPIKSGMGETSKRKPVVASVSTGSEKIDAALDLLILEFVQFYVGAAYEKHVCDESEVVRLIYEAIVHAVQTLVENIKGVNWTSYIALRFHYLFLIHCRIFLTALTRLRLKNPSAITFDEKDVLEEFFKFEQEYTSRSYKNVCSSRDFLKEIVTPVMYFLLKKEEFHSLLLREYLLNTGIVSLENTLKYISEPSSINHMIFTMLKNSSFINLECLSSVIKTITSQNDVRAIISEIAKFFSWSGNFDYSPKDMFNSTMKDLGSMGALEKICRVHLDFLNVGKMIVVTEDIKEDDVTEESNFEGTSPHEFKFPSENPNFVIYDAPKLTFEYILENAKACDHFVGFLENFRYIQYYIMRKHLMDLISYYNMRFTSIEYKSGIFLYKDPILKEFQVSIKQFIDQFKSYKEDGSLRLLKDNIFDELIKCSKSSDPSLSVLNSFKETLEEILKTDAIFKRFCYDRSYLIMCVDLNLVSPAAIEDHNQAQQVSNPNALENTKMNLESIKLLRTNKQLLESKTITIYVVEVAVLKKQKRETILVNRRFKEFYQLNIFLCSKFPSVGRLSFPEKKLIGNKNREFILRRFDGLNVYFKNLLGMTELMKQQNFRDILFPFFTQNVWKAPSYLKQILSTTEQVDTFNDGEVISAKAGDCNQEKDASESNFTKVASFNPDYFINDVQRISVARDDEFVEKEVLAIFESLIDEVFDLKHSIWIRRKFASGIKQFIFHYYGDKAAKTMIEFIDYYIGEDCMSFYIDSVRRSLFGAHKSNDFPPNHENILRIMANASILGYLPSEFKKLIGDVTAASSVHKFFCMFQFPNINRRLFLVLICDFLDVIFSKNNLKMHLERLLK